MNKNLVIIGIVFLLITVGLSGCNEETGNTSGDTNLVEVVNHNFERVGDYIIVTGMIKNIADRNLDRIRVNVLFYDSDNELLHTETETITYLANGNTANFSVYYYKYDPYFESYHHYNINIEVD